MNNEDLLKQLKKEHKIKFKKGRSKEKIQKKHTISEGQKLNENKTVVNDKTPTGNVIKINDAHYEEHNEEIKSAQKINECDDDDINNLCPPNNNIMNIQVRNMRKETNNFIEPVQFRSKTLAMILKSRDKENKQDIQ